MFNNKIVFAAALCSWILPIAAFAWEQQISPKPAAIEAKIAAAELGVKNNPNLAASYNALAAALCRKGRNADDPAVYEQAELAISHSLRLSPANYEARKLQVAVLLGEHQFGQALKLATELNRQVPDDLGGWASLVDANVALGNYGDAEQQAQWILDLRPGNTLGFEKSAMLRELFGDVPGAIEFLDEASQRTSPNDVEERAWLLTRKARLQLASGFDKEAYETLQQALQLSPESQLAKEVLAQIFMAQGKFREAADLLGRRYQQVKSARNLYDWAEALERSGQRLEAAAAFKKFEAQAEADASKPFNANLELVFFDLNQKHDPASALELAARLSGDRHDCNTLDAYAWALYSNGKYAQAKVQMERALAVGVREPLLFCHAAQIAARAGDPSAAANYQKEVSSFKGSSCSAEQAPVLTTNLLSSEAPR